MKASMTVREIMTSPVICARANAPIADIATILANHRISAVPVTDTTGGVIGLVSEYDLLARRGEVAADIMSPGIVSVTEDAEVENVRYLLIERRIRRVLVMNGNRLVGVISRSDLVRRMAVLWSCGICGEPVRDDHPPQKCPKCAAPAASFARDEPLPGN